MVEDNEKLTSKSSTEKTVAFYAGNSNDKIPTTPLGTIILDTAFTNVGNGYDTSTGVFTAPVSGLYDLQATFMEREVTVATIYAVIQVDGREVAGGVSDYRGGAWDETSIRAIVNVTSGQKVTLKNAVNAVVNFHGLAYTRFSGFLIKAD
ncbi:C1q-related factor-like [Littorina saxatilis]|uniref:C1q-related factor-like n=1 Tax=Littorina saxatilis TaxID=31220 RepID=UPI0038B44D8B